MQGCFRWSCLRAEPPIAWVRTYTLGGRVGDRLPEEGLGATLMCPCLLVCCDKDCVASAVGAGGNCVCCLAAMQGDRTLFGASASQDACACDVGRHVAQRNRNGQVAHLCVEDGYRFWVFEPPVDSLVSEASGGEASCVNGAVSMARGARTVVAGAGWRNRANSLLAVTRLFGEGLILDACLDVGGIFVARMSRGLL